MSLGEYLNTAKRLPYGPTDCTLPIAWALENNLEVDVFIVLTDFETKIGDVSVSFIFC